MTGSNDTWMSVGIDLSAEPTGTAIAVVTWNDTYAELTTLKVGADDGLVAHHLNHPGGPVGVDCPLGWPETFVNFISQHQSGHLRAPENRSPGWRREYVNRRTDLFVREHTGLVPLSVAADRIAAAALRLAALMSEVNPNVNTTRDGSGDIVEVYPAAALHVWGLPSRGYKGTKNVIELGRLVDAFKMAAPWFTFGAHEDLCRTSDDAFDATVCALIARAARSGATIPPKDPQDAARAQREGWIHLPAGYLPAQPWKAPC